MARKHYANALVARNNVPFEEWMEVMRAQNEGAVPRDHVHRIAKTVLRKCDPNQYLLSHATIVASVDTYAPKGVKLGSQLNKGVQIDVRYPDFRIDPKCQEIINNNGDAWSRGLLLSTYRTFIGAQNYCFVPGTKVQMSDGSLKPIEEVVVGDEVISHTGKSRKVVHKFERAYDGDVNHIYIGHRSKPITATADHRFYVLDRSNCTGCNAPLSTAKRPSSYKQRLNRQLCTDCGRRLRNAKSNEVALREVNAKDLVKGNILYSPVSTVTASANEDNIRFSKILGYYLAEGCISGSAVIFSFGTVDTRSIQDLLDSARALYPAAKCSVSAVAHSDHCYRVSIYSKDLAQRLEMIGGRLAHGKKLDVDYMASLSQDEILALIGAYISGDGDLHKSTNRIRVASVSEMLLQQVMYIGIKAGLNSFIVKHMDAGSVKVIRFKDGSEHQAVLNHDSHQLIFDVESSQILSDFVEDRKRPRKDPKSGDLRFVGDKRICTISKVESDKYSGMVYNLEVETDHSYVIDGLVAAPQCEHVQIPELSKGFIVDAIARDLGSTCYVDILVATDRKHSLLVNDILSGNMKAMSMGCISQFTVCTKCGNVASDDSQLCPCIQYEGKHTLFTDEDGRQHKIAELIGHVSVPNSNQFIEASWVKNPAFRGAVRRNFLNDDPNKVAALMEHAQAEAAKKTVVQVDGMKKAASMIRFAEEEPDLGALLGGLGGDDAGGDDAPPADEPEDTGAGGDESGGDDSGAADESAPKSKGDKIDSLLDKAQEQLLSIMVDRLGEKLKPKADDVATVKVVPKDLSRGNDGLVRGASGQFAARVAAVFPNNPQMVKWATTAHKIVNEGGAKEIARVGMKAKDLIALSWIEDLTKGRKYPVELYRLSMTLGPVSSYATEKVFLAAASLKAGRSLTASEKSFLKWKGHIASFGVH